MIKSLANIILILSLLLISSFELISQTGSGKYIYGFLIGFLALMIRVFNPAFPEGVMLAILFMNVMAPLIDHYIIKANVKRRKKRKTAVVSA